MTEWEDLTPEEQTKQITDWAIQTRQAFTDKEWEEMEKQAELDLQ